MDDLLLPVWLEKYRLDDSLRANAYEHAKPANKAGIKSAIALHFELLQEESRGVSIREKGAFSLEEHIAYCDISIFIVQKDFISPAQYIAALMPALLASSPICVVFKDTPSEDILLCLELLGLENVFLLSENENIGKLCEEIHSKYKSFICVSLGIDEEIKNLTEKKGIRHLSYEKKYTILTGSQKEAFKSAYPHAKLYNELSEIPDNFYIDIASTTCLKLENIQSSLFVGGGCEWYTQALFSPSSFLNKKKKFSFTE